MFKLRSSTLTSMFSSFSSTRQSQSIEAAVVSRPPTPRNLSKDQKNQLNDSTHRLTNSSLMNMSNTLENSRERSRSGSLTQSPSRTLCVDDHKQPTENLLDRSVKISFPKKADNSNSGTVITEAFLREKVSSFGQIMNVGMKDKLAVILFATSTQALLFCNFNNNCLGPDYKMKYMGTKEMEEEELQRHWQDRQRERERERETSQHEGGRNRTSSSSSRPDVGASRRSDVTAISIPSPPPSRGSNTNTLNSRFADDSHRSNRSQTKCGSETESENEQEYDRVHSSPSKQSRGERAESMRPSAHSVSADAEESAASGSGSGSGAVFRGHSTASNTADTNSGPKGWPTASKRLTVAVPTLCAEEPTFAPARRRSSSLLLQERQHQGQDAAPDGPPSLTPRDRGHSLSAGPQEGTDPEDVTPVPSPRASNNWKSARASSSHKEKRHSVSSSTDACAADTAVNHERNRSTGPSSNSSVRVAAASPSATQRDLSYASSVSRKKSEEYGDVQIFGSTREDINLSSGGNRRHSPEKGTRHNLSRASPNRKNDVIDGVEYGVDDRSDNRPDNRADGRVDERRDNRVVERRDSRPDNRVVERRDSRSDNRADGRVDERRDSRSDIKADERTDSRSDNRADGRAVERRDSRSDNRADGRSDERRDNRTDNRSDDRPDNRAVERRDNRSDERRDSRPDNRVVERRDSRPDNREVERRDSRSDIKAVERRDSRTDNRADGRSVERRDSRPDSRSDERTHNAQGEVCWSRSSPITVTVERSLSKPLPAEPLLPDSASTVSNKVVSEVVKIEGTLSQRHYEKNMSAPAPHITDSTRKLRDRGSDRERGRDHSGRGHSLERERGQLLSEQQQQRTQEAEISNHRYAAHSRREAADEELERMEAILDGLLDANKGLERDLGDSRQKILQLESEALVRAMEKEESVSLLKAKQDLWAVQLVAQTSRAMSLEEENSRLKEVAESMTIRDTVNHTKIASLSEFLRVATANVSRLEREMLRNEHPSSSLTHAVGDQYDTKDAADRPWIAILAPAPPPSSEQDSAHLESPSRLNSARVSEGQGSGPPDRAATAPVYVPVPVRTSPAFSPAAQPVRKVSEYPMKISDSLLQDLIATRREIEALSRMQLTVHYTGAGSSSDRPIAIQDNDKYSIAPSSHIDLHSIARGERERGRERETFQTPKRSVLSNIDYSHPGVPSHAHLGSGVRYSPDTYTGSTHTRTPPPPPRTFATPPLMSYYGHLLPPRQTPVTPLPSSRDDRRRAYLARLQMEH